MTDQSSSLDLSDIPHFNEACANCGRPRDIHKEPGDAPSGSLDSVWKDVDTCRNFVRCSPPRPAYGIAHWELSPLDAQNWFRRQMGLPEVKEAW